MNTAGRQNIIIRAAAVGDAKGIATVQHECWLSAYPNEDAGITRANIEDYVHDFRSTERLAKWRDIIATKENVTVAIDGLNVIGFSCAKKGVGANELAAIYVLPKYQGTGVAQELIKAALDWLEPDKDVVVEVVAYNVRAKRFYEKNGFTDTGENGHHGLLPTVFMRRSAH